VSWRNPEPAIDLLGNTPRMPDDRLQSRRSVVRSAAAVIALVVWLALSVLASLSGHDHFKRWVIVMINAVTTTLLEAGLPQLWDRDDWTPATVFGLIWLGLVWEMWSIVIGQIRHVSLLAVRMDIAPSANWLGYDPVQRIWRFVAILVMTGYCGWWLATASRRAQSGDWPKTSTLAAAIAALAAGVWVLVN